MNPILSSLFAVSIGYVLGSIPSGFLITKVSTGKNILEIGWRKTSGSNVFRNIGFWQGFLTGILDVGKGFLAVWLAKNFGFSPQIQALSGVAAVTGHNWSIFLKFAGGRGIGTFFGAFLALSPKILGFSLIPSILLVLIWNASIATIFFLLTTIILTAYFGEVARVGLLPILSLLPIFIKRLSPIGELSLKKKELIRNRLIFDNDEFCPNLRLKEIIKHLTKSKNKLK